MLRLHAPVNSPYRLAVKAAPADTVEVTVTAPDLTTTVIPLTVEGDIHSAPWVPDQLGDWNVEVTTSSDPELLNQIFIVDVAHRAPAAFVFDPSEANTDTGNRLLWPCPNLAALKCITEWGIEPILYWLNVATSTVFADTCHRFPGVHNYAKLRPNGSSSCLTRIHGTYGVDLWPALRYPALEIVDIEIDGASVGSAGWRIEGRRYLVPNTGTLWPTQDPWAEDGAAGTWSATVRYGRLPEPLAVTARDRFAYSMLVDNEPTTAGGLACALPSGTTSLNENGRTINIDPDHGSASAAIVEEARRRWRCRGRGPLIVDPVELNRPPVLVAPGDPTPIYTHAAFLASGCDLEAELAALATP